jgi:sigma-B regulation protein RsbU (phosphoserine phosphatase)
VRLQCRPGDTLFFYTDGITDAVDPDGLEFGAARLSEIILNNCDREAPEIVNRVIEEVGTYCRCESNFDDQTAIGMKVV